MPGWPNPSRGVKVSLALASLVALTLTVGWFWFGWGYVAKNRQLMDSLPVPPDANRIGIGSHSYADDESPLAPPDGWGTRATFRVSPSSPHPLLTDPEPYALSPIAPFRFSSLSRQPIADFYISRLSPDWQYCVKVVTTFDSISSSKILDYDPPMTEWKEIAGVRFVRGDAIVSVDTSNIGPDGSGSFDIYVDHKDVRNPCRG